MLAISLVYAHSLTPSPIDYPKNVTDAMCDRTDEIKARIKTTKTETDKLSKKNDAIRFQLLQIENNDNSSEIEDLIELNRKNYSASWNRSFMILMNYADAVESACMGDDGYYWIKTNNKTKLKEFNEIYNTEVDNYNKFLTEELLPKIEKLEIKKYDK